MLLYIRLSRALSKSGVFLLLGLVFLFMGFTKDTYVDWNTGYAGYVLIGGGLSLLIGLFIFIQNLSGSASTLENQQEDFLFNHIAPEEKRKYLALGALFSLHPYRTVECLNKFFLQKPEDILKGKENINESWGIVDMTSAKKQLDWLLHSGHRNDKTIITQKNALIAQLRNPAELTEEISELIKNVNQITYSIHSKQIDYINPNIIYNFTNLSGWDYIRGASMAKDCYNLGYLDENETWRYILAFNELVVQDFSSWEQLAVSFLVGRYIWSGDPYQEWYIEHFSWLFSFYPEDDVNEFQQNIWKKYPVSEL